MDIGPGPGPTVSTRRAPHLIDGDKLIHLPLCCAYGAGRGLGTTGLSENANDDPTITLFTDGSGLRSAEEWLLRLDYAASKPSPVQERQQQRLAQVKGLLQDILPEIGGIECAPPTPSRSHARVEFDTPYGRVPLRRLGYGYQTLIAWMVDFASRLVESYPDSPNPLAEPAIVLVDEIDLHLHPKWQRELIGHLTKHFPNTQFIATAHSPLVVQAASGANLAVLRREGDQVIIDNDVGAIRGWRVDQVLTSELFGLPSARPPELDALLARRIELLSKVRLTPADKRELEELEARIGPLPGGETREEMEMQRFIRETLEELKNTTPANP
jgi:predicted ATP-binding protein involved in virulence